MATWLQKIETRFWDVVILLLSQSTLVRSCLGGTYDFFTRRDSLLAGMLLLFCTLFGLLSGCVFYSVVFGVH